MSCRKSHATIAVLVVLLSFALQLHGTFGRFPRGVVRFYNAAEADASDGYVWIPVHPPAQRCYSFSCTPDSVSFVKWYETQEEAWLVFFDDVGCTGNYARVFGPDGKKKLGDLGLDNKVASFMLWESGMYPTRGLIDLCFGENAPIYIRPSSLVNHDEKIPSVHHNTTTTGIDFSINGDDNRGVVRASSGASSG